MKKLQRRSLLKLGLGTPEVIARFALGLAATTNLSQTAPWGLWIGFDILCGVGLAAGGFTAFVKAYPKSPLAPSAQYWIGNAQFAQKDYRAAIASQRQLVAAYPDSAKVPDALLNIASSQFELGDAAASRRTEPGTSSSNEGQPQPEWNFVSEWNNSWPQAAQAYVPGSK